MTDEKSPFSDLDLIAIQDTKDILSRHMGSVGSIIGSYVDKYNLYGKPSVFYLSGSYIADLMVYGQSRMSKDLDIFILDAGQGESSQGLKEILGREFPDGEVVMRDKYNDFHGKVIRTVTLSRRHAIPFQFIITDYKTPEALVEDFDFVHCSIYYDILASKLTLTWDAFDAARNNRLKLQSVFTKYLRGCIRENFISEKVGTYFLKRVDRCLNQKNMRAGPETLELYEKIKDLLQSQSAPVAV